MAEQARATAKKAAPRTGPTSARTKGPGRVGGPASGGGRATPRAKKEAPGAPVAGRYTAPIPRRKRSSPLWVPILLLSLLIAGVLVIVLNYLKVLPGGASDWNLLIGLALICGGFVVATQYR